MSNARPLSGRMPAAAALVAAVAAFLAVAGCTGAERDQNRGAPLTAPVNALVKTVDPGTPTLPPGDGFVGSQHCIGCHGGVYASYEKTAHARGLRTAGRPAVSGKAVAADSDGDGKDDFKEGLDLATTPAFAAYGAAAPKLSYVKGNPGTWRVSIAGVAYDVVQVYGGSLREDYLVKTAQIGGSLYPAPMEWDVKNRAWLPLETGTWYAGTSPLFNSAGAAAAGIDKALSAERRCIGCHTAGFTTGFDTIAGEWRGGYTELGVGCESCHGPGREHVASGGDKSKILDPRDLLDDTASGAKRADDTCARCHSQGTGGSAAGAPSPLLTPWSTVLNRPFVPGDDAGVFITPTSDPADYWGYKDNFLAPSAPTPGDTSDDTFIAARSGYMQGVEQSHGAHAPADTVPGSNPAARCFDCHSPHGSTNPSLVAATSTLAPGAKTSNEDGSLCLACHAGSAPFPDITAAAVAAFTKGQPSGVPDAVIVHMKDIGMPVDPEDFDPRGTGVGRCSSCHMPSTAQERRGSGTDADGNPMGGPRGGTHTVFTIWPSASARRPMTNACNACHPAGVSDPVEPVIDQWATGDPDGDGRFHGYTPRGEFLGNLNASSGNGLRCAQCHTTAGFQGITVSGLDTGLETNDPELAKIVNRSARMDEGITCAACHGKDGSGLFAGGANPLRIQKPALCSSCHFSAGITFSDYTVLGTAVHFPQKELMEGTAGVEPPGSGFYESADHAFFADKCVQCHFDAVTPGVTPRHDFQPQVGTCQVCHPSATSLDIPTFGDYDGDGVKEGIQGEVSGLLAILKTAILTGDAAVTFDATGVTGFRRNGVPGLPGATVARQRTAFNWETISKDGSKGSHNGPRAVKLLQQSYKELTGVNVPGAVIR